MGGGSLVGSDSLTGKRVAGLRWNWGARWQAGAEGDCTMVS